MVLVYIGGKNIKGLEDKIDELELCSKNKNIIDVYGGFGDLKEGYRP
jgi:hypothetical protein